MSLGKVLAEYVSRNGLDGIEPRTDGGYLLIVDDRYKVRFVAEGANVAMITSRIGSLPTDAYGRDNLVTRLLGIASARIRRAAEILTVTEDERDLLLFRRFPTDVLPSGFEAILSAFINELAFWQRTCSGETSRSAMPLPSMMHSRVFR